VEDSPNNPAAQSTPSSASIPPLQRVLFGIILPLGFLFAGLWLYHIAIAPRPVEHPRNDPGAIFPTKEIAGAIVLGVITFVTAPLVFGAVLYAAFTFKWKHWSTAFFGGLSAILVGVMLAGVVFGSLKVLSD
jgi:hypothetical protein